MALRVTHVQIGNAGKKSVTQVASVRSERVSRAWRWCTRALVVLAGTVAASAAAWAVSTASAVAVGAESPTDARPGAAEHRWAEADRAFDGMRDAADEHAQAVRQRAERAADAVRAASVSHRPAPGTPAESGPATDEGTESSPAPLAGDAATSGRTDAGGQARELVEGPIHDRCGDALEFLSRIIGSPDDDIDSVGGGFDDSAWRDRLEQWFHPDVDDIIDVPDDSVEFPVLPVTLPAPDDRPASASGAVTTDTTQAAPESVISVNESGTSSRGASHSPQRDTHDLPSNGIPMRMPAGAPTAPFGPASGHAGHGNTDGSTIAATFGSGNAMAARLAGMALSGTSRVPFEPGRQPGVTPD